MTQHRLWKLLSLLAALVLVATVASPAYAEEAVVTIDVGGHGSDVPISCVVGETDLAEAIQTGYLATLHYDETTGRYDFDGETLYAIAARPASAYTDESDLQFESVYYDGWLDIYNWGAVEGDGTFYAIWESDFSDDPAKLHHHVWKYAGMEDMAIKKGSLTEGGYYYNECTLCGSRGIAMPWPKIDTIKLSKTSYTYDGKAKKPSVTVMSADGPLPSDQYTVTYANNRNAGTATAKVTLTGRFYEGTKSLTFKITKAPNSAKAAKTTVKKSIKAAAAKKKAQTVALPKVTTGFGKATWKVVTKDKKKALSLKSGKVVVKKGAKKGTYTIKLKATVSGTANYGAAATKVVTVKVVVTA